MTMNEQKKRLLILMLPLLVFAGVLLISLTFCGKALALPQDWPCDEFVLSAVEKIEDPTYKGLYKFQGTNGDYQVTISEFDIDEPVSIFCGNGGCFGDIKNLKTGEEESMHFECRYNLDNNTLECHNGGSDEYIFTKFSDDEYRAMLCGGKDYLYILKSECKSCSCLIRSPIPNTVNNWYLSCVQENDKLHCFTYYGYEAWRNFKNELEDFENCVGLGI